MIHCLVLGDSIAVGVGMARPDCETVAKVGITSKAYVQTMLEPADTQTMIVSLGANDDASVDTEENLRELRRTVRAQSVVWLLPGLKDPQRAIIRQVAASYGDRVIDTKPQAGPDHLHPTGAGYRYIAEETEQVGWDPDPVEVAEAEEPGFRAARQNARRLFASRALAERMRLGREDAKRSLHAPEPRAPSPAASRTPATIAPKHAMVVHANDRTTLSDGSQCIRLDERVYCAVAPKIVPMIDPLRDHRAAAASGPAAGAASGAAAKTGRQALAN